MKPVDIKEFEGKGRQETLKKAWGDLISKDILSIAESAAVEIDAAGTYKVIFLGESYEVDPKTKTVRKGEREASPFTSILILHYLAGAGDSRPTGKLITFRKLVGGDIYYSAFRKRSIDPITETFSSDAEGFLHRSKAIGGEPIEQGDVGVRFMVFPKIPVTVLVWGGDSEIPGSANVLFDETAGDHMPTEDLSLIGAIIAARLISGP